MAQTVAAPSDAEPVVPHSSTRRTRPTPGVSNNKLAIWMFIASEALFFGAFIATYFLYRGRDAQFLKGPTPSRPAEHPVHVGHVVRAADELAHDGARARRDPAGRSPAVPDLAPRHRACSA